MAAEQVCAYVAPGMVSPGSSLADSSPHGACTFGLPRGMASAMLYVLVPATNLMQRGRCRSAAGRLALLLEGEIANCHGDRQ